MIGQVCEKPRFEHSETPAPGGSCQMQSVLSCLLDGGLMLDREGTILDANSEAEDIFGVPRADMMGKLILKFVQDDHAMQILFCMAQHEDKQGSPTPSRGYLVEAEIRRADKKIPVEMRVGSVRLGEKHLFVVAVRDVSETRMREAKIIEIAHQDALTGLPNRALMLDRLAQIVRSGQRHDRIAAIMFIDLDRFKNINDTQGHDVGDAVLREISSRLKSCVRQSDTIARQGGDEFVAILTDIRAPEEAAVMAERLLQECRRPVEVNGRSFTLSASIGIALYPSDGATVELLMKHADTAMYHAKNEGKNQFHFFSPQMNLRAVQRVSLEAQMVRALRYNQFMLHYQPQLDMKTHRMIGMEALIRWDSDAGVILPGQFIPVAEETALIIQIGEWAIHEACRQIADWNRNGICAPKIGVNLSCRQFSGDIVAVVKEALRENRVPAHTLELEITESMLAKDPNEAILIMHELCRMGIELSIDDFGTGYSNLSSLKKFPIKTIKIDREFVSGILEDENDKAIVQAILDIARHMKLNTLAEGIETEEHRRMLHSLGCNAWQGFLFSRPLPPAEVERRFFKTVAVC